MQFPIWGKACYEGGSQYVCHEHSSAIVRKQTGSPRHLSTTAACNAHSCQVLHAQRLWAKHILGDRLDEVARRGDVTCKAVLILSASALLCLSDSGSVCRGWGRRSFSDSAGRSGLAAEPTRRGCDLQPRLCLLCHCARDKCHSVCQQTKGAIPRLVMHIGLPMYCSHQNPPCKCN